VLPAEDRRLGEDLIVRKSESRVLSPGQNIPGSEHDRFMFDCITYSRPWPIEVQPATVLVTVPAGTAAASPSLPCMPCLACTFSSVASTGACLLGLISLLVQLLEIRKIRNHGLFFTYYYKDCFSQCI
jgi:hypothetical protein